ncbi:MAG: response regulator [bacterium]
MDKKIKVLVVDDEEEVRNIFSRTLDSFGYQVLTAKDGKEAITTCHHETPDIVLLDIKMPDMDGIETLRRIREIDPQEKSAVIMLTGHGDINTAREAMKLGAYDYVTKPFDLNFIRSLFEEVIREKECEN